mmetsp:Transcript_19231/g.57032  ORF Transcript_19231/g.57032 Transcript_19231/m.57032 type:complete len:282 (-) Transcript_19231:572-1417(-)
MTCLEPRIASDLQQRSGGGGGGGGGLDEADRRPPRGGRGARNGCGRGCGAAKLESDEELARGRAKLLLVPLVAANPDKLAVQRGERRLWQRLERVDEDETDEGTRRRRVDAMEIVAPRLVLPSGEAEHPLEAAQLRVSGQVSAREGGVLGHALAEAADRERVTGNLFVDGGGDELHEGGRVRDEESGVGGACRAARQAREEREEVIKLGNQRVEVGLVCVCLVGDAILEVQVLEEGVGRARGAVRVLLDERLHARPQRRLVPAEQQRPQGALLPAAARPRR